MVGYEEEESVPPPPPHQTGHATDRIRHGRYASCGHAEYFLVNIVCDLDISFKYLF